MDRPAPRFSAEVEMSSGSGLTALGDLKGRFNELQHSLGSQVEQIEMSVQILFSRVDHESDGYIFDAVGAAVDDDDGAKRPPCPKGYSAAL